MKIVNNKKQILRDRFRRSNKMKQKNKFFHKLNKTNKHNQSKLNKNKTPTNKIKSKSPTNKIKHKIN